MSETSDISAALDPVLLFSLLSPTAKLPTRAHASDAGMDVYTPVEFVVPNGSFATVGLGLSCSFPSNYALLVHDRSGLASKSGVFTIGGVIDSGYRGEIHATLVNLGRVCAVFNPGDKVAQLLLVRVWNGFPMEVPLSEHPMSDRGTKGLGSTGR